MEKILAKNNMNHKCKRVVRNKGKYGTNCRIVNKPLPHLKKNGDQLQKDILKGKY